MRPRRMRHHARPSPRLPLSRRRIHRAIVTFADSAGTLLALNTQIQLGQGRSSVLCWFRGGSRGVDGLAFGQRERPAVVADRRPCIYGAATFNTVEAREEAST